MVHMRMERASLEVEHPDSTSGHLLLLLALMLIDTRVRAQEMV